MKSILLLTLLLGVGFVSRSLADDPLPTDVVYFGPDQMAKALLKGGTLLGNGLYQVQTSRRVKPGVVEIHEHDTDIFYILEGTATFVTGGTAVEPVTVKPGQIHAKSITGGTTHHLSKGDVIVIPNGIPHQFTEVPGPFVYFVVKVTR